MMNIKFFTLLLSVSMIFFLGFDKARHNIPLDEIHSGGPPKDGIPALLKPQFIAAKDAGTERLRNGDRVLGIFLNGQAKAYPIKILNWHEIVNDHVGGQAVAITFCPLCGTGMIFDAMIGGRKTTFGVSGLLYQSDVLLYDHQTESLWSQIKSESVTGEMTGAKLKLLPSSHTTWKVWKKKHPNSLILSTDTGYRRNYQRDPYEGYDTRRSLIFPVNNNSDQYHPKEQVIGIEIGGKTKAYPFSELAKGKSVVKDTVGGVSLNIFYDASSKTATIRDKAGKELPSVVGFWFAWYSFHPDTEVFKGRRS